MSIAKILLSSLHFYICNFNSNYCISSRMVEGSKNVKELGRILKIPSYHQVKGKSPNCKKLNPHGRCLTFEEFSLERERE